MNSRFIRIAGTAHHVVRDGDGPHGVLITGGLGGAWFDWDDVVPALVKNGCTVVRFDRPGNGLSEPGHGVPTLAGEAERLAEVAAASGLEPPYTVVAHSLAGFHAEALARLRPDLVGALVLVDPSNEPEPPEGEGSVRVARGVGAVARLTGLPLVLAPLLRGASVALMTRTRHDPADPYEVRRVYGSGRFLTALLTENAAYPGQAAGLLELRLRTKFPDIPAVVLAAGGEQDRWTALQRALAHELHGTLEVFPDAGHLLMFDRPDAVAASVLRASRCAGTPGASADR